MITGIDYLKIFSAMITDWETSYTDLQANYFCNLGRNNSGNILVGNHAAIFTEINSPRVFFSVGNVCVDNGNCQRFTQTSKQALQLWSRRAGWFRSNMGVHMTHSSKAECQTCGVGSVPLVSWISSQISPRFLEYSFLQRVILGSAWCLRTYLPLRFPFTLMAVIVL